MSGGDAGEDEVVNEWNNVNLPVIALYHKVEKHNYFNSLS